MTFTCDRCHADYEVREDTARARLYVRDHRCNHLEARCDSCGATEIIYLGPMRLQAVLAATGVPVSVHAEATADLRLRAETAWSAAETSDARAGADAERRAGAVVQEAPAALRSYQLTDRHERLLAGFADALANIPDELLWDGMTAEHGKDHPERWTD